MMEPFYSNPLVLGSICIAVFSIGAFLMLRKKSKGKKEDYADDADNSILGFTPLSELKETARYAYPWDEEETKVLLKKCSTVLDYLVFYESAVAAFPPDSITTEIVTEDTVVSAWQHALQKAFDAFMDAEPGQGEVHAVLTECKAALHRNQSLLFVKPMVHFLSKREQSFA